MSKRTSRSWATQAEARVPEGPEALAALAWDLQNHNLERPIGGRVQISVRLRRRRPQEHYLYSGGLRPGSPLWAPIPQCFLAALPRALKQVGILARNASVAGIHIRSTWAPEWDEPGYSIHVSPPPRAGEDPATYRYAGLRRLFEVHVVAPFEPKEGRPMSWREQLRAAILPYYNHDYIPDNPLAVRIRVVRQPGHRSPHDLALIAEWVSCALRTARLVRADLIPVMDIVAPIESGSAPLTTVGVWRLPEFGRGRRVATA